MKTEFISLMDKLLLKQKLQKGQDDAIDIVLNEFDRLEAIIKDYEMGMAQVTNVLNSTTFKKPAHEKINKL